MAMVAVWLEILDAEGVPSEHYDACYKAEMSRRTDLKAEGQSLSPMTADDLCAQWRAIRRMNAEIDEARLLPENASAGCQRCFGKGMEEMLDGSLRAGCEHQPFTDDELAERQEAKARSAAMLREALKQIGVPKPPPTNVVRMKPRGVRLVCTNEACARRVSTLYGFEAGQECQDLLNRGDHSGELKFCHGTLEARERPAPEPSPEPAGVAFTITQAVRQQLYDLNYTRADVDAMKPEEARQIVTGQKTRG